MKIDRQISQMILRSGDEILVGRKKDGFGKGKFVLPGGKVEAGESPREAAIRECEEECGLKPAAPRLLAKLNFENLSYKGRKENWQFFVYGSEVWEGELRESEELSLASWLKIKELDYAKFWQDYQHWAPYVLAGEKVEAYFHYNEVMELDKYWVEALSDFLINRFDDESVGAKFDSDKPKKRQRQQEESFLEEKDNPKDWPIRRAARAVLIDEKMRVALMKVTRGGYYKLPGGGVDEGELIRESLAREVREEAGYEIEPLEQIGHTLEYPAKKEMLYLSYAYLARAKDFVGANLTPDEIEDGFELEWFDSIDKAIEAAEKVDSAGKVYSVKFFIPRELAILRAARPIIRGRYGG